ncbi:MAG: hypothetical protein ACFE9S_14830 [Candidatus Hermodarchaeota archaeon]
MLERSQSFDVQNKSYDEIQTIMENILEKSLSFSIKSKRLGRSLLRINYFDKNVDLDQQKDNRITILQESDRRVYIQIKGKLLDTQIKQLWSDFEKKLTNSTYVEKIETIKPSKEEIIQEIKKLIELKGYIVKDNDVQTFIENFIEKFNRMPEESEFDSIVKGYIIMINEDTIKKKTKIPIARESSTEREESVLDIIDDKHQAISSNNSEIALENSVERRKCPSCGDESSIHEVIDKSVILMAYPRIYGKKKYCGLCGYEWK